MCNFVLFMTSGFENLREQSQDAGNIIPWELYLETGWPILSIVFVKNNFPCGMLVFGLIQKYYTDRLPKVS